MSESAEAQPPRLRADRTGSGGDRVGASRVAGGRQADERRPGRIRGIGLFIRQVIAELRKVIWPTRRELVNYTTVVVVFVTVMVLIVSLFDFAFSQVVLAVFGDRDASG
ncbi:MAG: preprotein translocase subunit SecE [Actinomycetota bacterium]|nr:preprotein translocase subunit SecE [Actinomycetota bacterium]